MTYRYDPELAEVAAARVGGSFADVAATRRNSAQTMAGLPRYRSPIDLEISDRTIPGAAGVEVPVRIYAPRERTGPLPGVVYFHGGGFIVNAVADSDLESRRIAAEVGAVVISVDYRLAPEHSFPAALDDCFAALEWTAKNAAELGVDPGRIGVGGESAGGGLAAAVALRARDEHGPSIRFLRLMIPMLDDRSQTPSARAYTDTPVWNRAINEQCWSYYLGAGVPGSAEVSPYAAPARAEDLSALPPTYLTAMQFDPLRDEQIEFAQRLLQAGVNTEFHCYPGTYHGSYLTDAAISRRILTDSTEALRRGLVGYQ
ncbi:alpha/beta hydrolase [Nocardia sp. CDC159]|uniref:Alpha/beta hydrolase n=1 Tax=Nocardia pulmonis TaxID=2951408 RepID=A0A9X2J0I1_9NOCA|nr:MULTISPECIES: alpha/beta hydrolase [Nocardia]MCM6778583.1 alpha/beta hydrolase [Nocardia pulmonis]MCM6791472.1 alpha/beta hydrolase [Nocardia sp. CDC159]